jgi:predicted phosphodiesterase
MRLAVLSDIHGNLIALEAALADMASVGAVDMTWCLGDLAAFGSRPAECIRRIKALAAANEGKTFKVIGGNTDRYLVTGERMRTRSAKDEETFKKLADDWGMRDTILNWNVKQLSFEDYEFLKKMRGAELSLEAPGYGHVIGYHAVPGDDEAALTADTPVNEALDFLLDREGHLAVGGHIHRQMDRDLGRWRVINVGSVGMAFDTPGQAGWGLFTFDADRVTVELRRVPYDVDAAIADLHAADYPVPEWAAARLRPAAPQT